MCTGLCYAMLVWVHLNDLQLGILAHLEIGIVLFEVSQHLQLCILAHLGHVIC